MTAPMDRQSIVDELARVRETFRQLATGMSDEDLRRGTNGTRWTNRQLLFHMLFAYWLMWPLLSVTRMFSALPPGASKAFAAVLNFSTRPFHVINYLSALPGAAILRPATMVVRMDTVTTKLAAKLAGESDAGLARGMRFPPRWDPFFKDFMTRADLYHYPTQHFDFHRRQLS